MRGQVARQAMATEIGCCRFPAFTLFRSLIGKSLFKLGAMLMVCLWAVLVAAPIGSSTRASADEMPPPGISGHDDRSSALGPLASYRDGVGRLLIPAGHRELRECTAFCIGQRWIMTAAHCLADLVHVPRGARFISDSASYPEKRPVAIAWPQRDTEAWNAVVGGVSFPAVGSRHSIRPEQDWVALPLALPACQKVLPVLPIRTRQLVLLMRRKTGAASPLHSGFSVLAHHGDKGHERLLLSAPCGLADNQDAQRLRHSLSAGVILHDCDLAFGASGSPLFLRLLSDRFAVVGMNVAIFERNRARIGRLSHGPLSKAGGTTKTVMRVERPAMADDGFVANMAVSSSIFASVAIALQQEGPPLTDRLALASLQRLLKTKGLDPGPIDGLMGPRTRRALIAFRRSQGMEPVALASSVILEVLRDTTEVSDHRSPGVEARSNTPRLQVVPKPTSHIHSP